MNKIINFVKDTSPRSILWKVVGVTALGIVLIEASEDSKEVVEHRLNELRAINSYEPQVMASAMQDFSMSEGLSSTRMMKVSSAAKAVASPAVEDVSQKKIQETHYVEMVGDNSAVKETYEYVGSICDPAVCEINSARLYQSGSQNVFDMTLKIEGDAFEGFLDSISSNMNGLRVVSKSRTTQDRTSEYADIAARKRAQEALRERLVKLVASYNGNNIKSLLEVERELARVQGQIESMDARMRSISYLTDRFTLNLNVRGEIAYAPTEKESEIQKAINSFGDIVEASIAKMILIIAKYITWIALFGVIYGLYRIYVRVRGS